MSRTSKLLGLSLVVIWVSLLTMCSDEVTSPLGDESFLTNDEAIDIEITGLASSGVRVEESIGVFSIGWNQWFRPRHEESEIIGEAFAVGFDEPTNPEPPLSPEGISMGSVYLNCPDIQIELNQKECRHGGIVYSSFSRPFEETGAPVNFFPDMPYQFEVTGSEQFDPITFSVTSPPALIAVTSHTKGEWLDPGEDLTITWDGEYEDRGIRIFITDHKSPGPPGHGPGHGPGPGPGHRPRPRHPLPGDGIIVELETNTGEYTVLASELEELLSNSPGNQIMVRVTQVIVTEIDHGGETLLGIVRTGDGVMLNVQ